MDVLQIVLYVLGSILLIALIVLSVKLIKSINRVNSLLDDVEKKMETVDQVFSIVDKFADSFAIFNDKLVDFVAGFVAKLFTHKNKKIDEEDEV